MTGHLGLSPATGNARFPPLPPFLPHSPTLSPSSSLPSLRPTLEMRIKPYGVKRVIRPKGQDVCVFLEKQYFFINFSNKTRALRKSGRNWLCITQ